MEVQARSMVDLKKGHFEQENERLEKYTLADELPTKLSELSLRRPAAVAATKNMSQDIQEFTVKKITPDDKERVLEFLRKFFFRDEPLNVAVKLLETPEARCLALEEYAMASLDDDVSLMAVDHHDDIVGVAINGICRREEPVDVSEKAEQCADDKFRRVLRVLAHLDREAQVWRHVGGAGALLELRIVSTHAAWRGRGLMRRLCEQIEMVARAAGCGALRMDTTSAFSAAVAERLQYSRVYTVAYADVPGAPVPQPPHTHASVYVKSI